MVTVLTWLIVLLVVVLTIRILLQHRESFNFYTTGIDAGFKVREIRLLNKIARAAHLEEPTALYWSIPALNQGIAFILSDARNRHVENTPMVQAFLSKLYAYRTKVELDPRNSKSLKTTKGLQTGQRLRVVFKGHGVFTSRLIHVGRELIISTPMQKGQISLEGSEWIGQTISVYLQRANDAGYVFDSVVHNASQYNGTPCLFLEHTENLIRTQKRKSVRVACTVPAQMYLMDGTMNSNQLEAKPGLKCVLEDISEDGAMIRIGGCGRKNIRIKIQFELSDRWIVMYGIIRAVEFNKNINQSRLHFECLTLDSVSRNAILSYVYDILPQEKKDELEAISGAAEDLAEEVSLAGNESNNDAVIISDADLSGSSVMSDSEDKKVRDPDAHDKLELYGSERSLEEAVEESLDELPVVD